MGSCCLSSVTGFLLGALLFASSAEAQFPLPTPQRPTSFPLQRPAQIRSGVPYCWGAVWNNQTTVPSIATNLVQVSAGQNNCVALTADGLVLQWGFAGYNQTFSSLTNRAISVEGSWSITGNSVALLEDGSVLYANGGTHTNLTNLVDISYATHTLGLRSDGSVVAVGGNLYGETTVPAGLTNVVDVATALNSSFALLQDGTVVAWGRFAQFAPNNTMVLPGWSNLVQIDGVGPYGLVGLTEDGSILSTSSSFSPSSSDQGQFVQVVGCNGDSGRHALGLKRDGSVVALGNNSTNDYGQFSIPAGLGAVFQIAAGEFHNVVLIDPTVDTDGDGMPIGWELKHFGAFEVDPDDDADQDGFSNVEEYSAGRDPRRFYWLRHDQASGTATYSIESLPGVSYEVWISEDLRNWSFRDAFVGDGNTWDLDYYTLPKKLFFRTRMLRN